MKTMLVFILILLFSYMLGQWLSDKNKNENLQSIQYSNCDLTKQSCQFKGESGKYFLKFSRMPSALIPFDVLITTEELNPQTIELTFEMNDMNMGFNTHYLTEDNGSWNGRVILPVCSLGRNDWVLSVKMQFEKITSVTVFKFSQSAKN
jgi:hypothetical protein